MEIKLSSNIRAKGCEKCRDLEPWDKTIADLKRQLDAHGVAWPSFRIIHGKYRSCAEARGAENFDGTLYIIAVDTDGKKAKDADLFDRKDPSYVGVSSVLKGNAFHKGRASCERCVR